jgi:hypothetical protein
MRHQRQGWRRLVALPVALLGALVIAPGLASAGPNTTGATVLDFTDCDAHVVVAWSAQPGRFKSYTVEIWSDHGSGVTTLDSGPLTRNGRLDFFPTYAATLEFSNPFHAVTHVYDGKGVEQDTWTSNVFPANCI